MKLALIIGKSSDGSINCLTIVMLLNWIWVFGILVNSKEMDFVCAYNDTNFVLVGVFDNFSSELILIINE